MEKDKVTRKSRFSRSDRPPVMILQDRDKRIVGEVFEYRFLTRTQIQRLFSISCLTRANIRLRKLFDHGYLDRLFRPTVIGTSESIYTLGESAIPLIARMSGLPERGIRERRRLTLALRGHSLEHDLAVSDFRISVTNEVGANHDFDLVFWHDAGKCEHRFEIRNGGQSRKSSLRPDGYFRLLYQGKIYSFFLEIDRGTSSLTKLEAKFLSYLDFKNWGLYQKAYDLQNFYVLVVAQTPERANDLLSLAGRLKSDLFWFGSGLTTQTDWLTEPVWQRLGTVGSRPLFRPAEKVRPS